MEGENAGTASPGQGPWAENNGWLQLRAVHWEQTQYTPKPRLHPALLLEARLQHVDGSRLLLTLDIRDHFDLSSRHFCLPPAGGRKQRESGLPKLSKTLEKATTLKDCKEDKGLSSCCGGKTGGLRSTRKVLIDPRV